MAVHDGGHVLSLDTVCAAISEDNGVSGSAWVVLSYADQPSIAACVDGARPPNRPKLRILVVSMSLLPVKDFAMLW